jgi:hypothetical protein
MHRNHRRKNRHRCYRHYYGSMSSIWHEMSAKESRASVRILMQKARYEALDSFENRHRWSDKWRWD